MIIRDIQVANFRCIENESLPCQDLTILVGANGTGKSSFLRALDLFYNPNAKYDQDDFYARDLSRSIITTVTFSGLTTHENQLFAKYVEDGMLTVEKEMRLSDGRMIQRYYAKSLQNPDFDRFRAAAGQGLKTEYLSIKSKYDYNDLPDYQNKDQAEKTLREWEESHRTSCVRRRDDGQFFGFKEVGTAHLERYTRFLFVPAVREASLDSTEGKSSALTGLLDLVVRSTLSDKPEFRQFELEMTKKYDEIIAPEKLPELGNLAQSLTHTLQSFVAGATVELEWERQGLQVPMPDAAVKLVEDGFPTIVEHTGHGLQRAFILTMLQHLALAHSPNAQVSTVNSQQSEGLESDPILPTLIICIEEPELYQHPDRQRHLSNVLRQLSKGGISGVTGNNQVIYSTHSPLFLDLERFDQVRVLRKEAATGNNPKRTRIFHTTLEHVAEMLEAADGKPLGTYTVETLKSRLRTLMTVWMNEGFFAKIVALTEGEDDRAIILGAARASGCQIEGEGISIIPCMGKGNLEKSIAIFASLGIRVYPIWDSDKGTTGASPRNNHQLLRILNEPIRDWPAAITSKYACFETNLVDTVKIELGKPVFDTAIKSCMKEYGYGRQEDAIKNPYVIETILRKASIQNKSSSTLKEILRHVCGTI